MLSYVYMKILESQPKRYDRGIRWLSFGHSEAIKARIVAEQVEPGMRVLEIGCGTGSLAIAMARRGAEVVGFDLSPGMLAVARDKIAAAGLEEQVTLREMGIAGMDALAAASHDLVVSTLVFSELSADERGYALAQAHRILTPGGRLIVADEVRPRGAAKRLLHAVTRAPVALLTFAATQTSTSAVAGLEEQVAAAAFTVEWAERTNLDAFLFLGARRSA